MPKKVEPIARIKKEKFNWGRVLTLTRGNDYSAVLRPAQQMNLSKLKSGNIHSFKDENGTHWDVKRDGDIYHFSGKNKENFKLNRGHLQEEVENMQSTFTQVRQILQEGTLTGVKVRLARLRKLAKQGDASVFPEIKVLEARLLNAEKGSE